MTKPSDRVLTCVDKGLSRLGGTVKHVVYWYIENEYGLKREEIPEKPEEFVKGLEKMYGPGAQVIERNILKEMSEEFGVTSESFIEAVKSVKGLNDKPD
ncbi:MAG: hypothetical protein FGF53_04140 [Candidatus Brockarchaeota archaeon]|nr:hypothetical protein [Candidatus Brockarchaeota archaeon]MBO3809609.1 hypothetical protein [Candidatus Brockarchaeota archaeon]